MIIRKLCLSCFTPIRFIVAISRILGTEKSFISDHRKLNLLVSTQSQLYRDSVSRSPSNLLRMSSSSTNAASRPETVATTSSTQSTDSRSYSDAIASLNTLQSNAAVIEQIRLSGGKLNELAMPEFIEYLSLLGYKPEDLNQLNVIHITGTKGKGSTAAFCDGLLRQVRPEGAKVGESICSIIAHLHQTQVKQK